MDQAKDQLVADMPGAVGPESPGCLTGTPEALPERIARAYVDRMERADGDDPFIALIRSAASDERAATALYRAMRERSLAAYGPLVTGPDADERVDLLGAHLIGVTFSRYVIGTGPLSKMTPESLVRHLARTLSSILEV
ncbi:TetR/AcrR family transcriptional regulator [Nonomuraea solani]|uniref:TetR/AcrR family transcriptional regulator n=1 Tax=Nonomuraea solani TaxID=1144553 RepID=UPI0011AFD863|nr:hypothetical protein [Nonomuraea solani]